MIEIDKLSFSYGKKRLFENLSLELGPGLYGLLGKNGAGKSSLLKLMTGQLRPGRGQCRILGFNPFSRNPEMLEHIYYLPEEFLLPSITGDDYLLLYSKFYTGFDIDFFRKSTEAFEIETSLNLGSMSYGQKKKFMISFGLASSSKILFLDEPTNGLDIPSKSQFRRLAAAGASDERIILISTHQVRDMENLIDPVIIVDEGKIIFNCSTERIAENFRIEKVLELPDSNEIIYSEKTLGGYIAAIHEKGNPHQAIDLEFLFNMVLAGSKRINEIINGEIQ